jgi:hypothetical protein
MTCIVDRVLSYDTNAHIRTLCSQNHRDALLNYTISTKSVVPKILRVVALFVAAVQEACWRVFEPLANRLFSERRKVRLLSQIQADIQSFGNAERMVRVGERIDTIIRDEKLDFGEGRQVAREIAKAVYATTYSQYTPVIAEWTRSLLARAKESNTHLVFIARDGLPAYVTATILQQKEHDPSPVGLSCVYISRSIAQGPSDALRAYLGGQSFVREAVEHKKKLLFVDIGFFGSTISDIRKALSGLGVSSDPKASDNQVDFEYFISTSSRARGFAGNLLSILPSVESASRNRGVYWMEDTHQGVIGSPSHLVRDAHGDYVPNTVAACETCKKSNVLDYLCKSIADIAIQDFAQDLSSSPSERHSGQSLDENMRVRFDKILLEWKGKRFSYLDHYVATPSLASMWAGFVKWLRR